MDKNFDEKTATEKMSDWIIPSCIKSEEDIFRKHESNVFNLLETMCRNNQFVNNFRICYSTLSDDDKRKVIESLDWNEITQDKMIQDFTAILHDIQKK